MPTETTGVVDLTRSSFLRQYRQQVEGGTGAPAKFNMLFNEKYGRDPSDTDIIDNFNKQAGFTSKFRIVDDPAAPPAAQSNTPPASVMNTLGGLGLAGKAWNLATTPVGELITGDRDMTFRGMMQRDMDAMRQKYGKAFQAGENYPGMRFLDRVVDNVYDQVDSMASPLGLATLGLGPKLIALAKAPGALGGAIRLASTIPAAGLPAKAAYSIAKFNQDPSQETAADMITDGTLAALVAFPMWRNLKNARKGLPAAPSSTPKPSTSGATPPDTLDQPSEYSPAAASAETFQKAGLTEAEKAAIRQDFYAKRGKAQSVFDRTYKGTPQEEAELAERLQRAANPRSAQESALAFQNPGDNGQGAKPLSKPEIDEMIRVTGLQKYLTSKLYPGRSWDSLGAAAQRTLNDIITSGYKAPEPPQAAPGGTIRLNMENFPGGRPANPMTPGRYLSQASMASQPAPAASASSLHGASVRTPPSAQASAEAFTGKTTTAEYEANLKELFNQSDAQGQQAILAARQKLAGQKMTAGMPQPYSAAGASEAFAGKTTVSEQEQLYRELFDQAELRDTMSGLLERARKLSPQPPPSPMSNVSKIQDSAARVGNLMHDRLDLAAEYARATPQELKATLDQNKILREGVLKADGDTIPMPDGSPVSKGVILDALSRQIAAAEEILAHTLPKTGKSAKK